MACTTSPRLIPYLLKYVYIKVALLPMSDGFDICHISGFRLLWDYLSNQASYSLQIIDLICSASPLSSRLSSQRTSFTATLTKTIRIFDSTLIMCRWYANYWACGYQEPRERWLAVRGGHLRVCPRPDAPTDWQYIPHMCPYPEHQSQHPPPEQPKS